jgi:hypothetical protein
VHFAQVIGFGVPAFGIAAAWPQLAAGGRRFASVALIATVAGSIAGAAGALVEATLLPVVLRSLAPTSLVDLFKPGGPLPELVIPMVVTILFWLVGHVLLGIAVLRSGMLPKAMGAILIAGTVLQFTPLPGIGHGLTIFLHDTGLLWLAAACLRRDAVPHRPAGAATPRAA